MKSGASDPFADDTQEGDPESTTGENDGETESSETTTDHIDRSDLPYAIRRDNVKDERSNVHQLFVQERTDDRATDAERELETILDEDVYRLDAREAIYLAGMENIDDAAAILREWGYDF